MQFVASQSMDYGLARDIGAAGLSIPPYGVTLKGDCR